MELLFTTTTVALQIIIGQFLGFIPAYYFNIGNGWELLAFAIGNTIGVWGVGAASAAIRRSYARDLFWRKLAATAIGSILGVLLILITPATGLSQVLYPLLGALLAYHLSSRFFPGTPA